MTAAGSMPWRAPARAGPAQRAEIAERGEDADHLHLRYIRQSAFSSTVEGNTLTYDQQRAKLDLIVAVAHDIWG
jgi:5-methyltetrahydropteroyltriglutamate--homocysteine methyltransferase